MKKIIVVLSFLLPISLFAQTKFFVSKKENDSNPGTQTKPFASIDKALSEAKKKSGSIVVYFSEGTYYLKQPVVFTAKDFGKENNQLSLTNFKNQKVTFSGAVPLKLQ